MKPFKYRRRSANSNRFKVGLVAFLALVVFLSFTTFYFYSQYTDSLSSIANLQMQIQGMTRIIENKTTAIENLKSEVKSKQFLISDLSNRLGIATSEIGQLTPVIKTYYTIGVTDNDKGVVIPIEVKITKGTGIISVDIKNVELLSEVQDSVRIAVKVAQDYTDIDFSKKDVTVSFINEDEGIVSLDGPSAGSVITTTIIAAAENKTLNKKILMTGTIEMDGSIGQVGGVREKALAAKEFGADVFLVPAGEKVNLPGIEIAEVKSIQEPVNLILS
jgi:ATP-dependent Lon protease